MMQLTRDTDRNHLNIKSYQPHQLVINETLYSESVILTPYAVESWPPKRWTEITTEHIQQLAQNSPEIILLGTGEHQHFLDTTILLPLIQRNLSVEIMSTSSACYTFKILASENRAVIAGLIV